ncbi:DEAD/DEAH box helicase [Miltoncostaea oceani]|uniref:DEAD/DEAH box helicase n=1 Tax=Miltoncostaea oceani TaxID=2843216 RepID=UPI001C3C44FF|nr:DEAD/DEAH box helicase [Miltoncostaea oceani]
MARSAKVTKSHRALIDEAIKAKGVDAMRDLQPLALSITPTGRFDARNPAHYLDQQAFEITPVVDPLFEAVMVTVGAVPVGRRSFSVNVGEKASPRPLAAVIEAIPTITLYPAERAERNERDGIGDERAHNMGSQVSYIVTQTPAGAAAFTGNTWAIFNAQRNHGTGAFRRCAIYLSETKGRLFFRICTAHSAGKKRTWAFDEIEGVSLTNMHLMRPSEVSDPMLVSADVALRQVMAAEAEGLRIIDPKKVLPSIKRNVRRVAVAMAVPGSPGMARLVLGSQHNSSGALVDSRVVGAGAVVETLASLGQDETALVALDPRVSDITRVQVASPVACETLPEALRPFQQEMVGRHLATTIGVVNGCAPGTGKTVMSLAAWREKGLAIPQWRGLCVVPKPVLSQWGQEAEKFFPEARVLVLRSGDLEVSLARAEQEAGIEPLLAICSYDAARRNTDALCARQWDDLGCDEAAILNSVGSGRTKALWRIRDHASVAVAMTGTPIDKSLDDLGIIGAWARNEQEMFHGERRLSRRFVATEPASVASMWDALGPFIFRRDRSEIADQLPAITTQTLLLDPEPAEKALAEGARHELRAMYDRLVAAVEAAGSLDPDSPDFEIAKSELRAARGAVLGGVTLARAACCDPQAVKNSSSAGAALLDNAGLIDPAVKTGGTKRREIINLIVDQVGNGEAVLMFTDFSGVCDSLASGLREAGVRCGTYSGSDTEREREADKAAFMRGDLDCLILTGAGREGLNLQRASVVINYDLPWVPRQLIQRIGRAARFGSSADRLQVIIPILAGTIEERVAAVLIPRAMTALAVLDVHRGIDARETEIGLAISGLTEAISDEEKEGQESMFALTAAILAA